MELMRVFGDAVVSLNPDDSPLDEGTRFPICRPSALKELFSVPGMSRAAVTSIDIPTLFSSFEAYWEPFLGGQRPAPAYVASLGNEERACLRNHIKEHIPIQADGSIILTARAWAAHGTGTK
jgi:hypothetical protein